MDVQLEFIRNIYAETLDWYKTAEKKAEILLGILGGFIVFASGIMLANPNDTRLLLDYFAGPVLVGLLLTFTAILYALYAAYQCLKSRLDKKTFEPIANDDLYYPIERMYFFQHHAGHEPGKLFASLKQVDVEKEIAIYSSQIIALSKNVVLKHKWINRGLEAVCLSILLLLVSTVLYISGLM
jgi:hypothetical protein